MLLVGTEREGIKKGEGEDERLARLYPRQMAMRGGSSLGLDGWLQLGEDCEK